MEADWSVELGADDPVLEMPWASPDGSLRWQDLRRHPKLIPQLAECNAYPELVEPLRALNSHESPVLTAKCDAFVPEPTEAAEELFGSWRMVGYIDLVFATPAALDQINDFSHDHADFDFALHEKFARNLCARINDHPENAETNAAVELVVRRCVYKTACESSDSRDGFYVTAYVIGYGETAEEARRHWGAALSMCSKVLLRLHG
jgi:hypothetical protein